MADSDLTPIPDLGDATLGEPPPPADPGGEPGKKGFLSTTLGKVVAIGGAVMLLGAVVAVAAFLVITFVFVDQAPEMIDDIQAQIAEEMDSATDTGTVEPPSDAGDGTDDGSGTQGTVAGEEYAHQAVGVGDLHVWRDIFQPLLTPVVDVTLTVDPTGPDDGGDDGTTYAADTLYLLEIFSGSTETAAQFYLNGIDYNTTSEFSSEDYIVVMEGERLQNTAWRLIEINNTSVELQYGDSTVNLSIGQGVKK